jgi:hypothetical protein
MRKMMKKKPHAVEQHVNMLMFSHIQLEYYQNCALVKDCDEL